MEIQNEDAHFFGPVFPMSLVSRGEFFSDLHMLGRAPPPIHVRCVGLNLGGTKWSRRGSLCKVRQDVGEKLAFPEQLSEKVPVETWASGCQSLNLWISQEQDIKGRCAVSGFFLGLILSLLCYLDQAVTFG